MPSRSSLFVILAAFVSFSSQSYADAPYLVKDINTFPDAAMMVNFVAGEGPGFFLAFSQETGMELWTSDGTPGGTRPLEIIPGPASPLLISQITPVTFPGDVHGVVFLADDGVSGQELWRSDGTQAGTRMVTDLNPGAAGSNPTDITPCSPFGAFYVNFVAENPTYGRELFRYNLATEAIDVLSDNIRAAGSSYPDSVVCRSPVLFYSAENGTSGRELWRTVLLPPPVIAQKVLDLPYSNPMEITVAPGGLLLFQARGGAEGTELWKSNGNIGNGSLLMNLDGTNSSSSPSGFKVLNATQSLFRATSSNHEQLWVTDGTALNTKLLKDFDTHVALYNIYVSNNIAYFPIVDPAAGYEIWRSDGTVAGTGRLKDIYPGLQDSRPQSIIPWGPGIAFGADDGVNGRELWFSDGTENGTKMFADLMPGPNSSDAWPLFADGNKLYFNARTDRIAVWEANLADWSVQPKLDMTNWTRNVGSHPAFPVEFKNQLFFAAEDRDHGNELYRSDGTEAGTTLVADLAPADKGSSPYHFKVMGDKLFFSADTDGSWDGGELWVTDGTSAGTRMVKDIYEGLQSSNPMYFADLNGVLYFTARDATHGGELWRSDGTYSGTYIVRDILAGPWSSQVQFLQPVGDKLFFPATDNPGQGTELWKSDGTESGTVKVKEIRPGNQSSNSIYFADLNGIALFSANDGNAGDELWRSDGTESGTYMVKDINGGALSSSPLYITTMGGAAYFLARGSGGTRDLWRTDGTEGGTTLVKSLGPIATGVYYSDSGKIFVNRGKLYFSADDGVNGMEPWISDGTLAGTYMLSDTAPGAASSRCRSYTALAGFVFFECEFTDDSAQLYRTDGTPQGTVAVMDTVLPYMGDNPALVSAVNGRLFFSAFTTQTGNELWAMVVDKCPANDLKLEPGICGCGRADTDANHNGIADCLGAKELKAQIFSARALLKKLKITSNAKKKKAIKKISKQLGKLAKSMRSYAKTNSSIISVSSGSNPYTLTSAAYKAVTKARKLNAGTFRRDRKKALSALKKLEAKLVVVDHY